MLILDHLKGKKYLLFDNLEMFNQDTKKFVWKKSNSHTQNKIGVFDKNPILTHVMLCWHGYDRWYWRIKYQRCYLIFFFVLHGVDVACYGYKSPSKLARAYLWWKNGKKNVEDWYIVLILDHLKEKKLHIVWKFENIESSYQKFIFVFFFYSRLGCL